MAEEPSRWQRIQTGLKAAIHGHGIETHGETHLNPFQKFVHFWSLATRGFLKNRCPVRASALAYTTLLALIPLLAVIASVSVSLLKNKGDKPIESMIETIVANVAPQLDLVAVPGEEGASRKKVVQTIQEFINNISSGALGVTGMAGLVFVAIMLLSTIEATFNDIWGVTHGRTWLSRIIQYWATVTLGPLIPLMAVAVNTGSQFQAVESYLSSMPFVGHLVVKFIPFVILSLAFALLYQLMPNTRVRWQAALVGGMVGGSLWQMNSLMNVLYASRMENFSSIYGPLSLIPVFLVGLYFSWIILLFGAQVAYTFQNRSAYFQQRQLESVNELGREFVGLRVMTNIGHHFSLGKEPPTAICIGQTIAVPSRLVGDVLKSLIDAKLVVEVEGGNETAFTVARPLENISVDDILQAIRTGSGREPTTAEGPIQELLRKEFNRVREAEHRAASEVTLAGLVSQRGFLESAAEGSPPTPLATIKKQQA